MSFVFFLFLTLFSFQSQAQSMDVLWNADAIAMIEKLKFGPVKLIHAPSGLRDSCLIVLEFNGDHLFCTIKRVYFINNADSCDVYDELLLPIHVVRGSEASRILSFKILTSTDYDSLKVRMRESSNTETYCVPH